MTSPGAELVARLLAATPLPPPGAGVDELLAAFAGLGAARAELLAAIGTPPTAGAPATARLVLGEADRPLLVELERRQLAWLDALAAAQRAVGDQRRATDQLRAYAGGR